MGLGLIVAIIIALGLAISTLANLHVRAGFRATNFVGLVAAVAAVALTGCGSDGKASPEASKETALPKASKEGHMQALRDVFDSDHNGVLDATPLKSPSRCSRPAKGRKS